MTNLIIMTKGIGKIMRDLRSLVHIMVRLINERDFVGAAELMTDDVLIVRPTGNPLTKNKWLNLVTSDDFDMKANKLVNINTVELSEKQKMGYVCYTTHSVFSYKEKLNNDVAVFIAIFKLVDKDYKISYLQRSLGRGPDEPMPNFN